MYLYINKNRNVENKKNSLEQSLKIIILNYWKKIFNSVLNFRRRLVIKSKLGL